MWLPSGSRSPSSVTTHVSPAQWQESFSFRHNSRVTSVAGVVSPAQWQESFSFRHNTHVTRSVAGVVLLPPVTTPVSTHWAHEQKISGGRDQFQDVSEFHSEMVNPALQVLAKLWCSVVGLRVLRCAVWSHRAVRQVYW